MNAPQDLAQHIARHLPALPATAPRRLVAVAGPPASGKSTTAEALCALLNASGQPTGLVAMDGFHLDNRILDARNLRARKGAPETFDIHGFVSLLARLKTEDEVIAPVFDRSRDLSIGAASVITPAMRTVVVEGNYLLLDAPDWRALHGLWDLSVFLPLSADILEQRLLQRWRDHGFSETEAAAKTHGNDLPNALRVIENALPADLVIAD